MFRLASAFQDSMPFQPQHSVFVRFRSGAASRKRAKAHGAFLRGGPVAPTRAGHAPPPPNRKSRPPPPPQRTARARKKARRVYFDPSNQSLDFGKPNHVIVDEILANSEHRTRLRCHTPALDWEKLHGLNLDRLRALARESIRGARVSLNKNLTPLGLGDVVLLDMHSTELHLVAGEPQGLASSLYTFVNSDGEILQAPRHVVKLRIPRALPLGMLKALNLVTVERKHPGVAPVGIPEQSRDVDESRLLHDASVPEILPASEHDLVVAQAQTQLLTNSNVQTYIVPDSARQVYLRYLRWISIEAFQKITTFSSKLDYMHNVLQYDHSNRIITSVQTLPVFELYSYVSDFKTTLKVMDGVRGCRDKYKAVNNHIRQGRGVSDASDACGFSGLALPQNTRDSFALARPKLSSYIAFIIALLRSSRMWKINTQMSLKTPLSVDILPVHKGQTLSSTVAFLKQPRSIEGFADAYVRYCQRRTPLPRRFEPVVQMLRDFVAENIVNDIAMESLASKVVRAVDERVGEKPGPAYTAEYSKSRAYDIIITLSDAADTNPAYWNESLGLPGTGTSLESDTFADYFRYLDSEFPNRESLMHRISARNDAVPEEVLSSRTPPSTNHGHPDTATSGAEDFYSEDPVGPWRTAFGPTPVYCIDLATAHEIDDGISIQAQDGRYKITVHVANPTSYLKPNSILSQIACKKAATVYMPEGPSMMLPQLMSRLCGLNGSDEKTRTIAILYTLDKKRVDGHLAAVRQGTRTVDDDLAQKVLADMKETADVAFHHVTNFPKGYTYERVNEILEENEARFQANRLTTGSHEDNLFKLFHISSILKHARVQLGRGMLLNGEKSRVSVSHQAGLKDTRLQKIKHGWAISVPRDGASSTPVISIVQEVNQNNASRSQQLVSELMIGANYAGSQHAYHHQIPFIHRTQALDLALPARKEITRIMQRVYGGKGDLTIEETSQILSVMTSANYELARKKHESLGLEVYLNLTSPLRRYIDMVNHWNIQAHVQGKSGHYRQVEDLDMIANRLQMREAISKSAVRKSETFWTGKFLERYFAIEAAMPEQQRIRFSVLLQSNAKTGDVRAELVGFGALRVSIVLDENVRLKFALGDFRIGMVLTDVRFRVLKLDCIENDLTIQLA